MSGAARAAALSAGARAGAPALLLTLFIGAALAQSPDVGPTAGAGRGRARDFGVRPGVMATGRWNAITDVAGVRVGHVTIDDGARVHTGVTAVVPHGGNLFRDKVPGAVFVGNGFGKLTGVTQVRELGTIETPILLTGTLSVPRVADALISHMLALPGNEDVRSINPVVGETNDGYLSDIRARPVRDVDVEAALSAASSGAVEEGSVGAGRGTIAFGFKGGIGTASRRLPASLGGWTVGVLVQTNFGGVLSIDGAPVGRVLGRYYLREALESGAPNLDAADGSCMIVVATDAPLAGRDLERLALRAFMGMARTGASGSNGSGDYAIAFSSHPGMRSGPDAAGRPAAVAMTGGALSPLFLAAIESAEEAIYNSLFAAQSVVGANGTVEALPLPATLEILRSHGVIAPR